MKHGAGKKWYLQAQNYSADRVRGSQHFRDGLRWLLKETPDERAVVERRMRLLDLPIVGWAAKRFITRKMKPFHFGQVLTLDDVERVFSLVDEINLFPCVCRRHLTGKRDERYCFGLGSYPREVFEDIPEFVADTQRLSLQEATELVRDLERRGLVHTIWTLDTPFIVSVCSCRPGECLGLDYTLAGAKVMFKGEHRFHVDPAVCNACGVCEERCYFHAVTGDRENGTRRIDPARCNGCGLCASACPVSAISVEDIRGRAG
jgi:ferredoxin